MAVSAAVAMLVESPHGVQGWGKKPSGHPVTKNRARDDVICHDDTKSGAIFVCFVVWARS